MTKRDKTGIRLGNMTKKNAITQGNAAGQDTRQRLIASAVRHFAADGFAAASQRAIQRDAGVNPASAHYHFGSKAALYRATIENFIHGVQEERLRRHAALPKGMPAPEFLERLLYDYFWPGIAIAADREGYHYALILARLQGEMPGEATSIFLDVARPVRNIYLDTLQTIFPDAPRRDLETNLAAGVALMATVPRRNPPNSIP